MHGFPQAFCDAGAAAVIAPLIALPSAITPIFTRVLYRMLRYLPSERALGAALDVFRRHRRALVIDEPEAALQLQQFGPVDLVEFRYTGATGISLAGGLLSRVNARVSTWWWLLRLRLSSRRFRACSTCASASRQDSRARA
jgi:hypothetical protein